MFLNKSEWEVWQSETQGQFHQPIGAKCKCAGTQHLVKKDAIQFQEQNCTQLY